MIIELTEEEREFLERVCVRAKKFAEMDIDAGGLNGTEDMKAITQLIEKLKINK